MTTTRRKFLWSAGQAATVMAVGSQTPWFWREAAATQLAASRLASIGGATDESVLVVLQLSGGNDGLNTLVPYRHDAYRRARPKLAIPASDVLKVDDELGWHPAAKGWAKLLESQRLAVLQGVGYPEPNRSHFESLDIWHTCQRKGNPRTTGWLGRGFDTLAKRGDVDTPGLHLGDGKQPLALAAARVRVPSIASPEKFRLREGSSAVAAAIRELGMAQRPDAAAADSLLGFVQTSASAAISASDRITAALRDYQPAAPYPDHGLGQKFKTVAQFILAGLPTRVYYLELDGFDTHSQQPAAHAALLEQASGAMAAFLDDLQKQGVADRVLVMCFSEFGRRVAENASEGTDHGAAAPLFLAGNRVRSGVIGKLPSLTDLDDGDLKFHTDFRQVYAAVLENWLRWDSREVLGGGFEPVAAIDAT